MKIKIDIIDIGLGFLIGMIVYASINYYYQCELDVESLV